MWSKKKKKRAIDTIITYGKPHKYWLLRGVLATIGVVFFRLFMPWPLRWVVEVVFSKGLHGGMAVMDILPEWGDPILWFGAIYILLAVGLGICELIQRVNIMRFAAQTVHGMRADSVKGASLLPVEKRSATGEIISRIIGDSARVKAGLSGVILHGLQNGLLFLAVCTVLLFVSVQLGLIFLVAGLIALFIGLGTSTPVAKIASKQRRKEGDYAVAIQDGLDSGSGDGLKLDELNDSSSRKEVRTTKIIAVSSLYVHILLAVAVCIALWVGARGVESGSILPGELFLFIAYALTVHRRMVQVGRQSARSGKVLACADRISAFIQSADSAREVNDYQPESPIKSLVRDLRFEGVRLSSVRGRGSRSRLKRMDLKIESGSRVAVIGKVGSGKSSLLRILAGRDLPDGGKILWDDTETQDDEDLLSSMVTYLAQEPSFPPCQIWRFLGLQGPGVFTDETSETLDKITALTVLKSIPEGLDKKLSSANFSRNEARVLSLARVLLTDDSKFWVLDSPLQGLRGKRAARCIEEIMKHAAGRTLVMALSTAKELERFDRVIQMRSSRIEFDGSPEEFKRRKKERV